MTGVTPDGEHTTAHLCWCCAKDATRKNGDPFEGRLDGYCDDCAWARCDAYPGECPNYEGRDDRLREIAHRIAASTPDRHAHGQRGRAAVSSPPEPTS